jgi:hypothetical protein
VRASSPSIDLKASKFATNFGTFPSFPHKKMNQNQAENEDKEKRRINLACILKITGKRAAESTIYFQSILIKNTLHSILICSFKFRAIQSMNWKGKNRSFSSSFFVDGKQREMQTVCRFSFTLIRSLFFAQVNHVRTFFLLQSISYAWFLMLNCPK